MPKNKIAKYVSGQGVVYVTVAPNQKVVEVHKVNTKGKILDIESNRLARKELSLAAYSLYMHFMLNLPGYQEALSKPSQNGVLSLMCQNTHMAKMTNSFKV